MPEAKSPLARFWVTLLKQAKKPYYHMNIIVNTIHGINDTFEALGFLSYCRKNNEFKSRL